MAGKRPFSAWQDGERILIRMALKHSEGNKTAAAELLGINRKTLAQKDEILRH